MFASPAPLQLCRPLSGAVRRPVTDRPSPLEHCFNCAAPFRGRLAPPATRGLTAVASFNCAAPFRGRLAAVTMPWTPQPMVLQLCRPLSGAVSVWPGYGASTVEYASIVPPPFGSG